MFQGWGCCRCPGAMVTSIVHACVRLTVCCFLIVTQLWLPAYAEWRTFYWSEIPGDKAVMTSGIILPVMLDGKSCAMQLDTGAYESSLYRYLMPASYARLLQHDSLMIQSFGFFPLTTPRQFRLLYQAIAGNQPATCQEQDHRIIGTLGNDVLIGGTIRLDLPHARYQFAVGAYPSDSGQQALAINLEPEFTEQGMVPLIDMRLENGKHVKLVFDTGSASADVVVFDKQNWLELVGLISLDAAHVSRSLSWGLPMSCYSAVIKKVMVNDGLRLGQDKTAAYCENSLGHPFWASRSEYGLIGLDPFLHETIILDYVSMKLILEHALN